MPKDRECQENTVDMDNWSHRDISMRCDSCMWFSLKEGSVADRCRRHAPTMNGYPAIYSSDWCGDHKIR
jgi:hypothetical protein